MKDLKILTFNWHEGYIHLLAKTRYQFDVVEVEKGGRFGWIKEFRPVPENCNLISLEEATAKVKSQYYDRIICHNIHDLLNVADSAIPKVLLHHNKIEIETGIYDKAEQEKLLIKLKSLYKGIKNLSLVFISNAKKESWGLDGEVILNTADPDDYEKYSGNIRKVIRIGNLIKERDIHLGYSKQEKILKNIPSVILGLNPNLPNSILPKDWNEYKSFLKTHRVYFHSTSLIEDGYNLAMLEAMVTGMPIVSIANPTSPIEDGLNGFISHDEDYLRDKVIDLLKDSSLAKKIGKKARETVIEKFPLYKFIQGWRNVLEDTKYKKMKRLKILMSYTSNPVTTAFYIEKALRKQYDVITFGPVITDETLKLWDLEKVKDKIKKHDIPYVTPNLIDVFKSYLDRPPDIFLWVESGIWYDLEGIETIPCLTACYLIDSHLNLDRHLEIAKRFNCVFIAQKKYIPYFKEKGIKNIFWLPLACDPEIHGKKTDNANLHLAKCHDITFVGSLNNQRRVEIINKLKKRFNLYYERCFHERMAEVFTQSKIIFNISSKNDLNMRVFEALCTGSLLLTDEAEGSGLAEIFKDKRHLVVFKDEGELFELAEYYLKNDYEREKIAEEGMREVLSKHTYLHRTEQMIEILIPFIEERRKNEYAFDTHPEAIVLQPYCIGKGIDVGCGFRKTHPDAIVIDLLAKGEAGTYGCMKNMRSVADISASGDNLCMFKDNELDYVISRHNLEHYIDPVKTLREWKRVLKPDGILGIVLPDESKINTITLHPTHKHAFTPESIKNLLELIGDFEIERLEPVIENWSFIVIARKKRRNQVFINNGYLQATISDTSFNNDSSDYFRQERKEIDLLIPEGTLKVLDVGCGEGILGKRLLEKGVAEVVGIEVKKDVAKKAECNITRVICGDVERLEELPFEKGYFDCIIFADVLEHLKEPLLVLEKFKYYLSDSGVVIASIPNVRYLGVINMLVEGYWRYYKHGILDRTHLRFFTKKEIEVFFKNAGFEITGITENIDNNAYNSLSNPLSGEIEFGKIRISNLTPDELRDLFVFQYLIRAKKAEKKPHIDLENLEESLQKVESFLEMHPLDLESLYLHAKICHKMGLLDKVMDSLQKILIFAPESEYALELKRKVNVP